MSACVKLTDDAVSFTGKASYILRSSPRNVRSGWRNIRSSRWNIHSGWRNV